MTKWEYKISQIQKETAEADLNLLGKAGWEAILMRDLTPESVEYRDGMAMWASGYTVVLKRPIDGRRKKDV